MLDDDDRVSLVNKPVKDPLEQFDVRGMEADAGLLKDVESASARGRPGTVAPASAGQLGDEFDALGFTSAQGWTGLTEAQVAESGLHEELEGAPDLRVGREKLHGLLDSHRQDVTDRLPVILHLEGLMVEAGPSAVLARHEGDGKEVHLQPDDSLTLAAVASASLVVEGEPAAGVSADPCLRKARVEGADRVKDLEVGGGRGSGGFADGGLIDLDDLREMFGSGDRFPIRGPVLFAAASPDQRLLDSRHKNAAQEGALARPADAADRGEAAEREADIHAVKIVPFCPLEIDPVGDLPDGASGASHRVEGGLPEEFSGEGPWSGHHLLHGSESNDLPSLCSGLGAEIDDASRAAHGLLVVLDDEE